MNETTVKNLRNISIRFFPLIIEFNTSRKTNISFMVVYCSQNVSLLTRPFGFSKTFNDMHLSSFLVCVISDTNFVKQDVGAKKVINVQSPCGQNLSPPPPPRFERV